MLPADDVTMVRPRSAGVYLACVLYGLATLRVLLAAINLGQDGAPWQIVIQLVPLAALFVGLGCCLWRRYPWARWTTLVLFGLVAVSNAATLSSPRTITLSYGSRFYDISPAGDIPLAGRVVSLGLLVLAFGLLLKDHLDQQSA